MWANQYQKLLFYISFLILVLGLVHASDGTAGPHGAGQHASLHGRALRQATDERAAAARIRVQMSIAEQAAAYAAVEGLQVSYKVVSRAARVVLEAPAGAFFSDCSAAGPIRDALAQLVGRPSSTVSVQCSDAAGAASTSRSLLQISCSASAPAVVTMALDFELDVETDVFKVEAYAAGKVLTAMQEYTAPGQCAVRVRAGGAYATVELFLNVALPPNTTGTAQQRLDSLQLQPALTNFTALTGPPAPLLGPVINFYPPCEQPGSHLKTKWWICVTFLALLVGLGVGAGATAGIMYCMAKRDREQPDNVYASHGDAAPGSLNPGSRIAAPLAVAAAAGASGAAVGAAERRSPTKSTAASAVSGSTTLNPVYAASAGSVPPGTNPMYEVSAAAAGSEIHEARSSSSRPGHLDLQGGAQALPGMSTYNPVFSTGGAQISGGGAAVSDGGAASVGGAAAASVAGAAAPSTSYMTAAEGSTGGASYPMVTAAGTMPTTVSPAVYTGGSYPVVSPAAATLRSARASDPDSPPVSHAAVETEVSASGALTNVRSRRISNLSDTSFKSAVEEGAPSRTASQTAMGLAPAALHVRAQIDSTAAAAEGSVAVTPSAFATPASGSPNGSARLATAAARRAELASAGGASFTSAVSSLHSAAPASAAAAASAAPASTHSTATAASAATSVPVPRDVDLHLPPPPTAATGAALGLGVGAAALAGAGLAVGAGTDGVARVGPGSTGSRASSRAVSQSGNKRVSRTGEATRAAAAAAAATAAPPPVPLARSASNVSAASRIPSMPRAAAIADAGAASVPPKSIQRPSTSAAPSQTAVVDAAAVAALEAGDTRSSAPKFERVTSFALHMSESSGSSRVGSNPTSRAGSKRSSRTGEAPPAPAAPAAVITRTPSGVSSVSRATTASRAAANIAASAIAATITANTTPSEAAAQADALAAEPVARSSIPSQAASGQGGAAQAPELQASAAHAPALEDAAVVAQVAGIPARVTAENLASPQFQRLTSFAVHVSDPSASSVATTTSRSMPASASAYFEGASSNRGVLALRSVQESEGGARQPQASQAVDVPQRPSAISNPAYQHITSFAIGSLPNSEDMSSPLASSHPSRVTSRAGSRTLGAGGSKPTWPAGVPIPPQHISSSSHPAGTTPPTGSGMPAGSSYAPSTAGGNLGRISAGSLALSQAGASNMTFSSFSSVDSTAVAQAWDVGARLGTLHPRAPTTGYFHQGELGFGNMNEGALSVGMPAAAVSAGWMPAALNVVGASAAPGTDAGTAPGAGAGGAGGTAGSAGPVAGGAAGSGGAAGGSWASIVARQGRGA